MTTSGHRQARQAILGQIRQFVASGDEEDRGEFLYEVVDEFYAHAKTAAVPGGGGFDGKRDGERGSLARIRDEAENHRDRSAKGFPGDQFPPGTPGL